MSGNEQTPRQPRNAGDEVAPGTEGSGEDVCPDCHGSGWLHGAGLTICGGTGRVAHGAGGG